MLKVFTIFLLLTYSLISLAMDAEIVRMQGTILVDGKPLDKSKGVNNGQTIECVGKKSYVQVKLSDGSSFLLKNGKMVIKTITKKTSLFYLVKGVLFNLVSKGKADHYKIETSSGALGVRGTKFYTEADESKTYLCVCEGVVNFENKSGNINVKQFQDLHASKTSKLEIKKPSRDMWKMAKEGFGIMGVKLDLLP